MSGRYAKERMLPSSNNILSHLLKLIRTILASSSLTSRWIAGPESRPGTF